MAASHERHVVLGAGPLGQAVVRELLGRGGTVRVVNRSGTAPVPDAVEVVAGDLTDVAAAVRAMRGADVVYLCANAPYRDWPEVWPSLMHGAIEGAVEAGARLVFGDNLYMYGPVDGPLDEGANYGARGPKGLTRGIIATTLLDVHHTGKIKAVIGRASDFYGPGVVHSVAGAQVFEAALKGRRASLIGRLDVPHTFTFIDDFARALVTLGASEEAFGQVWHVPSAPPVTQRAFVTMVYEAAGTTPRVQTAKPWMLGLLGRLNPTLRELREISYMYERPFVVDHGKYEEAFGADVTPHEDAIRQTLDWYELREDGTAGRRRQGQNPAAVRSSV